ncbi:SOS response-associated peptidase family protein [Sphingomonas sp. BN140010]|uniref:Abasic site processing protein n=1 Tax=Sphingomonas arvum TaxID=2992113 RepID=A0ABT3JCY0_9SPHN|nr:SOS response-associated peptidase family protein [Sphingomonas sp. BN140010]MCW3796925.1 SOS response-associated peptidase family protein [Sphingomonas sp. BN140010]
MCNLYSQTRSADEIARLFRDEGMPLVMPDGIPNLAPRNIAITDSAPIVRAGARGVELVVRRWSWPGPGGKPVYNFRSDNREFGSGRCLILADGFYEFTAPSDPKAKRKDRWRFSAPDGGLLGIAGLVRDAPGHGEAFTMLTCPPGEDVAPYHSRQVAVLPAASWRPWLDGSASAQNLIGPLPPGSLTVQAAER